MVRSCFHRAPVAPLFGWYFATDYGTRKRVLALVLVIIAVGLSTVMNSSEKDPARPDIKGGASFLINFRRLTNKSHDARPGRGGDPETRGLLRCREPIISQTRPDPCPIPGPEHQGSGSTPNFPGCQARVHSVHPQSRTNPADRSRSGIMPPEYRLMTSFEPTARKKKTPRPQKA